MYTYKIGDKIKIVGRPVWHKGCQSAWLRLIGLKTTVVRAELRRIEVCINGSTWGLYPESVELIREGQLEFDFMYDD